MPDTKIKARGTKEEVFKRKAKRTSGGLRKSQIVRVRIKARKAHRRGGMYHPARKAYWVYKSKKQHNKGKKKNSRSQKALTEWRKAVKQARKELDKKPKKGAPFEQWKVKGALLRRARKIYYS